MLEHIERLSVDIGPRLAGSPDEQRAVDYLTEQLESWGYDVEVQAFEAAPENRQGAGLLRYATLTVDAPEEREFEAVTFAGAPSGVVSGNLVDGGFGDEVSPQVEGGVALIQRGVHRAAEAVEAGAIGVVIQNNQSGFFPGIIEPPIDVPAVGVTDVDGDELRRMMEQGEVEVRLNVRPSVTAHNVIARPENGDCRTLSGGHFDTVPWAPGANDNASGSSVVLELARSAAAAGLDSHCFALFGAEELGLIGSEFYVGTLSEAERELLEAYYNYDVTASDTEIVLIGDGDLATSAIDLASDLGIVDIDEARLPRGANSDHASFIGQGIAALMLTTPDFEFIHTPQDTTDTVVEDTLIDIAVLGYALLDGDGAAVQ
jgi:aminopeptidase YwaD